MKHYFKAFLTCLFSVLGILVGLFIAIMAVSLLFHFTDEEKLSTNFKIKADARGSRKELSKDAPVILEIPIKGVIGEHDLTGEKIQTSLVKSREDGLKGNRVKAILLSINSPGGEATDSDIIYSALQEYKSRYQVPVYAHVDGLAASGGYYIACAADKIYTSSVSLVGSIGVVSWPPFFNVVDLMQKVGLTASTLTAGKNKDQMNPTRPWKSDESKDYQELLDFFYDHFISIVTQNRKNVSSEKLKNEWGAKIFTAPFALQEGFIDGTGKSRSAVLDELAHAANIGKDVEYQVVEIETKGWLKKIINEESFFPKIKHELTLPKELQMKGKNLPLYIW